MADDQKTQDTVKPATDAAREQLDRLTVLQDADGTDLNAKDYAAEDSEADGVSAGMHGGANQSSLALASQAKPAAFSEDGLRASSFETAPAGDVHAGNATPSAPFIPSSFTSFLQTAIQTVQNSVGNINIFASPLPDLTDSPAGIPSFISPVARTTVTSDIPPGRGDGNGSEERGNAGGTSTEAENSGSNNGNMDVGDNDNDNDNDDNASDSGVGDNNGGDQDRGGTGEGNNNGSGSVSNDRDNGHGNNAGHADDSNPGQGSGNHGAEDDENDDSAPIAAGDHDQGKGNDGRDVGNDKTDENDHSGRSGGSGGGDPNDGDDARGNNHQNAGSSGLEHDDNGHGNNAGHTDDSNPGQGSGNHGAEDDENDDSAPIAAGDHDQGKGNDGRDVGNDKTDENDHSGRSGGSGGGDPNDGDDARGNNHQDHIDIPAPANTGTWDHQIDQSAAQDSGHAPTAGWIEAGNGADHSVSSVMSDKGGGKNKTGGGKNAAKEVFDTPAEIPDHTDSQSNGFEHADKSHGG